MSQKPKPVIRVKPKPQPVIKRRQDRQVPIGDLEFTFTNPQTFRLYKQALKKLNQHYGWEPDVIYYDRMNERADQIPQTLTELYHIPHFERIRAKLAHYSSLMTRCASVGVGDGRHKLKRLLGKIALRGDLKYHDPKAEEDVPEWEDLRVKLGDFASEYPKSVCGIIAAIYAEGYCLRVGELFDTNVHDPDADNYLDLETGTWHVHKQKNTTHKTFQIPDKLRNHLKDVVGRRVWLLAKKDGSPYGSSPARTLRYHGWPFCSCTTVRKSFERWNAKANEDDAQTREMWNLILGHSPATSAKYYE